MKSLIWTIWNRWIHRERRVMVAQGRVKEGWLLSGHKGWPCLGARQRWWCTCSKCTDPTELGHTFVIVQSLCRVQLFVTSWVAVHQASLSFTISQSLPKFISIESLMPSNHLLLCRQLLLPSIFPSIRVFSKVSALHIRWPNYWNFSISPSNEYSGLLSASCKEPTCQCRRCKRHESDPWVGKISWRRVRQPPLVFFPGEFHGQRSLVGYSPQGRKESDTTEVT